jgi:hypothetical protein
MVPPSSRPGRLILWTYLTPIAVTGGLALGALSLSRMGPNDVPVDSLLLAGGTVAVVWLLQGACLIPFGLRFLEPNAELRKARSFAWALWGFTLLILALFGANVWSRG